MLSRYLIDADDVRLTLQMRRQRRRLALTEDSDISKVEFQGPARQGRRAAVMPTDQLLMSQRTSVVSLASQTGSTDGAETENGDRSASSSRRVTEMADDIQKFLSTLETNIGKADNDSEDECDDFNPDQAAGGNFEAMITRQRIRGRVPLHGSSMEESEDSSHYSE